MMENTGNREILSAALSAHVSDLRLFWRETGLSCRWLVPDSEHCYVDEEMVAHLKAFHEKACESIVHPEVCEQWFEKSAPLLDGDEVATMPFPLRTLTWLLRVVESPHRDDLTIDSWNLYLWNVRLNDLPSHIMRKLSSVLDSQGKQALIDFDTLMSRFVTALEATAPKDGDALAQVEQMVLIRRFDRLRRFKNVAFVGIDNIGKANIPKELMQHWKAMTGREIGMHCVAVMRKAMEDHRDADYSLERRVSAGGGASHISSIGGTPRVIAPYIHDTKFFFEPCGGEDIQEGMFLTLCRVAACHPDKDYVFVVVHLGMVGPEYAFGEAEAMLDSYARVPWRKGEGDEPGAWDLEAPGARTVRLNLSGREFFIPSNVYVIGIGTRNLWSCLDDDKEFIENAFAVEYLETKSPEELRSAMLSRRSLADFARLEQYVDHSIELWDKMNKIFIRLRGHFNAIGYGPLMSMCEEILHSADVHEANRIVLGTWRYRMWPIILRKMRELGRSPADPYYQNHPTEEAIEELVTLLNQSWLRIHVELEGEMVTDKKDKDIYATFDPDFILI